MTVLKILLFFTFPPYWLYLDAKIILKILLFFVKAVEYVLSGFGSAGKSLLAGIEKSIIQVENHPKKAGTVFTLLFLTLFLSNPVELSARSITSALIPYFLITFGLPLIPLIMVNYANILRNGGVSPGSGAIDAEGNLIAGDAARRAGERVGRMAREGELNTLEEGVSREAIGSDLAEILMDMIADMPFGEAALDYLGIEAGAAAAIGSEVIILVILVALFMILLFVAQLAVVLLVFGVLFGSFLGGVFGPVANAVGGTGYGQLAANKVGFAAGGVQVEGFSNTIREATQTVSCFGNAACMRQWRFNNTERPGSEERGQEYSLEIEGFSVNDGFPLDITNRRADDRVPVDFSVYNPRHGLKGIEARDVAYRIRLYDISGSFTGKPICQTGWKPLGGRYADMDLEDGNGTIMPGGFATPLGTHERFNLEKCDLLQPALGINRRVKLQVAYNYSSQATLQVQAMSREHLRSLNERPRFKKSQTADTPVKTYVNVESPITYRVDEDTGRSSSIFGVRLGFETGQRGVKYRVNLNDFKFYDSSKTVPVDEGQESVSCEDLQPYTEVTTTNFGGSQYEVDDAYTFSEETRDYLRARQSDRWFKSDAGPSPVRCAMKLEGDVESISPTGETLTFRIDANYTVMLEDKVTGFKVQNGACTRYECPLLVPQSHENATEEGGLLSVCDSKKRIDANNGCGARKGENWRKVDYTLDDDVDAKIEQGETAYYIRNLNQELTERLGEDSKPWTNDSISKDIVVGVEQQKVEKSGGKALVIKQGENDVAIENLDFLVCADVEADAAEERMVEWAQRNNVGSVIYFNAGTKDCGGDGSEDQGFSWIDMVTVIGTGL